MRRPTGLLDHLKAALDSIPDDYYAATGHLESALAIARERYPDLVDVIEFALSAAVNEMHGMRPRVSAKEAVRTALEEASRKLGVPIERVTGVPERRAAAVRRRAARIRRAQAQAAQEEAEIQERIAEAEETAARAAAEGDERALEEALAEKRRLEEELKEVRALLAEYERQAREAAEELRKLAERRVGVPIWALALIGVFLLLSGR